MNTINVENCKTLLIGRRGENEVTTVAFDFTEWASEFGSGVVDLYVKRFGDNSAYPVVLTVDGTVASWLVTETDTNVAGYGKAEYVYRVDGKIAKSAVFPFFVAEDIGQPASEPPDPYESWLEQLTALGAETEAHAQAAEQSAENAAESAEDAAQSAASAEGYAGQAETAAGLAQDAQTASEAARDAAQTAQASAEASATAASGSAASAAGSATAAAGSASDASSSASDASDSAIAAGDAETQAEAAKTAAQAAQSAAEDAAEDAQQAAQQAHVEYEQLSDAVDDLSDEVSQQKSAIEDLEALTNRKAGALIDTASGAIASFVPDATIDNLLGVSVDIEPVQDLHGYDSPWPAGGGVNKLDIATASVEKPAWYSSGWSGTTKNANAGITQARGYTNGGAGGFTVTLKPGETYTISWTYNKSINDLCKCHVTSYNGTELTVILDNVNVTSSTTRFSVSFTVPSDSVEVAIRPTSFGTTQSGQTYDLDYIQIELGSTATAWTPYSNECPISGWDAVEVDATGENIWGGLQMANDIVAAVANPSKASTGQDEYGDYVQFSAGYAIDKKVCFTEFKPNTQYTVILQARKSNPAGKNLNCGVRYTTGLFEAFAPSVDVNFGVYVFTTRANYTVKDIELTYGSGTTYLYYANSGVFEGVLTADEFKLFAGNRYIIALGDTIYGAKLTISEDGSVNALIDRATKTLNGGENWYASGRRFGLAVSNIAYATSINDNTVCLSDTYPAESPGGTYNGRLGVSANDGTRTLFIADPRYSTVADFKSALAENNVFVVYKLDTPITITLDPVTIAAISGQTNKVWADTGDVSVEYAADVKTYIDNKIAAAVAAMS